MIKEVLKIVRDGGVLSKSDIADKMGIQQSTLENVFSLLSSKGYLRKIGVAEIPHECMCCSGCTGCMTNASVCSEYVITDKGKNYLEQT